MRHKKAAADARLGSLYSRPGFLLRRAHQIAVGIFLEECAVIGLTPPQHGVLIAVEAHPDLSQISLAKLLGFDPVTVGQVVRGLERRKLVRRVELAHDRRHKAIALTPLGRKTLRHAAAAMARTSRRLLAPFDDRERVVLIELLRRLTDDLNAASRTPLASLDDPIEAERLDRRKS